jgi:DNA-binding transcriptional ArsR family regulator
MTTPSGPQTDDLFTALAHPTRRRILRLAIAEESEVSPRGLASKLSLPLARVSYHVRILAHCGALELVRTRQTRGSNQHFYRPTVDAPWAREALATEDDARRDRR